MLNAKKIFFKLVRLCSSLYDLSCVVQYLSHLLQPSSDKLVPYILVFDYRGNKPLKPYAKLESGTTLVMYDDIDSL
jgi:hypothetical protein